MRLITKFISDGGLAALVIILFITIVFGIYLDGTLGKIIINVSNGFLG